MIRLPNGERVRAYLRRSQSGILRDDRDETLGRARLFSGGQKKVATVVNHHDMLSACVCFQRDNPLVERCG